MTMTINDIEVVVSTGKSIIVIPDTLMHFATRFIMASGGPIADIDAAMSVIHIMFSSERIATGVNVTDEQVKYALLAAQYSAVGDNSRLMYSIGLAEIPSSVWKEAKQLQKDGKRIECIKTIREWCQSSGKWYRDLRNCKAIADGIIDAM